MNLISQKLIWLLLVLFVGLGTLSTGCLSRTEELSNRGDELLYQNRFEEAARQFELVLHECGDKTDDVTRNLRISTLKKIADLKHFYLNDWDGALRTYRLIVELSPGGEAGYQAHENVVKLLRSQGGEQTVVIGEIQRLMAKYPKQTDPARWNIELAEIALRDRRYAETQKYALLAQKSEVLQQRIEASLLLASAQELNDQLVEALATYRALQKEPKLQADVETLVAMSIAHCLEKLGQLKDARLAYRQVKSSAKDLELVSSRIERINRRIDEEEAKTRPRSRRRRSRARVRTSTAAEY